MTPHSPWVAKTLSTLSLDEKIGQLLHPYVRPHLDDAAIWATMPPVRVGGAFLFSGTAADYRRVTALLQSGPGIPLVVSTDLESGAGRMINGATAFPDQMGLAATDSEELARLMGEATAVEARAHGVHWTFGPVVDINANPGNPITSTRSLGDDPERVARLAVAMVEGMQAHGLAATAKHFPGDGWDDRDQHLATVVNPLDLAEWERTSGVPFRRTFAAGCWTTMIGHIAMPAIDAGNPADPAGPPPATLSRAIATGFLRGTLGFEGLAVSDAIEMHGSVSRVRDAAELVVGLLNAGNDMLLFSDAKRDFGIIRDAVARGAISLARVDEACARVLALKERLGFAADPAAALPAADPEAVLAPLRPRFAAAAREVARRALTAVRMPAGGFPHLRPGDRVLAIHLRSNPEYNTDGLDTLLEERGMTVDRHTEANNPFAYPSLDLGVYRLILFCWTVGPTYGTNAIRPAGTWMRIPWFVGNAFPPCPVVHANFGTPYLVNDLPAASILVNAYSPDCHSQAAVADWLCGELEPSGVSPVDLDRPARIRELIRREYAGA